MRKITIAKSVQVKELPPPPFKYKSGKSTEKIITFENGGKSRAIFEIFEIPFFVFFCWNFSNLPKVIFFYLEKKTMRLIH